MILMMKSMKLLKINKGNIYILDGDKLYNINEDETKGKLYGSYINGKVKKIK